MDLNVLIIFFLGTSVGSFLNVLIDRMPKGMTILGRSHCDYCKKKIVWYDNIPLLSFLLLRGKCRHCRKRISWQYPVVELVTGILYIFTFISIYRYIDKSIVIILILHLVVISSLVVIFVADLKYRIIPDQILIVLIINSLLLTLIDKPQNLAITIFSGFILALIFLILLFLTKGKGMGMGDVKYAFFMGFFLGFPKVIIGFYLAFLTGAFISLILILIGKKKFGQTIAFGPFLVVATFVAYFWGDKLWQIFLKMMGLS